MEWLGSLVGAIAAAQELVRPMHGSSRMSDVFANKVVDLTKHLGEGLARCGFCQGSYSVELEIVCSDCASGLCPFCATRSSGGYLCPDCRVAHKRMSKG